MKGDYTREALQEAAFIRQSKRPCTDCGKLTHNYRCEKCWKIKRGFGFEDSGEVPEVQTGNLMPHPRVKAGAEQRRKKPAPSMRDDFKPMAQRPALPDRQAEFFARQEKKMKQQTYTVNELAALFGVSSKDVANAKYLKSKNPKASSKVAIVLNGMLDHGITWDQVVNSPRGKKPNAAPAIDASPPVDESTPLAMVDAPGSDPAPELADVVAGMEPEDTPPASQQLPLGQAIARELSSGELLEDVGMRLAGLGPVPGTIGAAMSNKDLLAELRLRFPGAMISIPI